jgi:hypothetical protein
MKFQKDDIVVCVNNIGFVEHLTINQKYSVIADIIDIDDLVEYVYIKGNKMNMKLDPCRFISLLEYRKLKINKLYENINK